MTRRPPRATLVPHTTPSPSVTVIVGSTDVTGPPPMVALIVVAVPAVPPVNGAGYPPFLFSLGPPIVPPLVPPHQVNTTVRPPGVTLFPPPSLGFSASVALAP